VRDYRIYFMSQQNRITKAVEMWCATDTDAAAEARELAKNGPVELWQRARFLGRFASRNGEAGGAA
jgi:hypothetical protein